MNNPPCGSIGNAIPSASSLRSLDENELKDIGISRRNGSVKALVALTQD